MVLLLGFALLTLAVSTLSRAADHGTLVDSREHFRARRAPSLTDLDRVAQDFVNQKTRDTGKSVTWWDLYGNHKHLKERPQYHHFKVDIRTSLIEYGLARRSTDRPQAVQKKTYTNRTNRTMNSVITWETRHASEYRWTVERGFQATWDMNIETNIPWLSKPKNKTTVSINTSREQRVSDHEAFSISYTIEIPPQTEVTAQWVITEQEQEVPFNVDVFVKGYIAVWYHQKVDGHWLWFYPVNHINDPQFTHFEGGLRFRTSGIFNGVRGIDSHIEVSEKSLLSRSQEPKTYSIYESEAVHGEV